jgi:hypothetical protein
MGDGQENVGVGEERREGMTTLSFALLALSLVLSAVVVVLLGANEHLRLLFERERDRATQLRVERNEANRRARTVARLRNTGYSALARAFAEDSKGSEDVTKVLR